jgi:hypothetical protein
MPLVDPDNKPTAEQVQAALRRQFEIGLLRQPTAEESQRFTALQEKNVKDAGPVVGAKNMLVTILMLPEAMYRLELGGGKPDEHGRRFLAPRELAYALAFSLTDEGPDAALLKAAEGGRLASKEDVRRELERMLNDKKITKPRILRFFEEYFEYPAALEVFKEYFEYPELTAKVPFPFAWEFSAKDDKDRRAQREARLAEVKDQLTPAPDPRCQANTYGFPHGIYSKYNFFMAYLDRCIALRLPAETPPAGQPTKLKPIIKEDGWAGDCSEVGEWNAIAPMREAKGMVAPGWLPDAYAAWMWRSYHSAKPDLKLTAPVVEYQRIDGKWGGPACGLGYGAPVEAGAPLRFAAETTGPYVKVELHDGERIVGTPTQAPWQLEGVKLERGLRVLFAVGVAADGSRRASRPAFLVVE